MRQAIIKIGGSQHLVSEGETIKTQKITGVINQKLNVKEVLALLENEEVTIGHPFINEAVVEAEILDQEKGKKGFVYKYKSKSRYRRKNGYHQPLTVIKIEKIKIA